MLRVFLYLKSATHIHTLLCTHTNRRILGRKSVIVTVLFSSQAIKFLGQEIIRSLFCMNSANTLHLTNLTDTADSSSPTIHIGLLLAQTIDLCLVQSYENIPDFRIVELLAILYIQLRSPFLKANMVKSRLSLLPLNSSISQSTMIRHYL